MNNLLNVKGNIYGIAEQIAGLVPSNRSLGKQIGALDKREIRNHTSIKQRHIYPWFIMY